MAALERPCYSDPRHVRSSAPRRRSRIQSRASRDSIEIEDGTLGKGTKATLSIEKMGAKMGDIKHYRRAVAKLARLTARAVAAALAFVIFERLFINSGDGAGVCMPIVVASLALGLCALLIMPAVLRWHQNLNLPQSDEHAEARMLPVASNRRPDLPPEHPYYSQIDGARKTFLCERGGKSAIAKEREERVRARLYRSHDPRRWRIVPARFGSQFGSHAPDACDADEPDFDLLLYDWQVAETQLAHLQTLDGLAIQSPPLAYTDDNARTGAAEAGKSWYFSIADFESALLTGVLELKFVGAADDLCSARPSSIMIELSGLSPTSIMVCIGES